MHIFFDIKNRRYKIFILFNICNNLKYITVNMYNNKSLKSIYLKKYNHSLLTILKNKTITIKTNVFLKNFLIYEY